MERKDRGKNAKSFQMRRVRVNKPLNKSKGPVGKYQVKIIRIKHSYCPRSYTAVKHGQ